MKRILVSLAALALTAVSFGQTAQAETAISAAASASAVSADPLGELISKALSPFAATPDWQLKSTVYHGGQKGMRSLDSLGCTVVPMRTLAVDPTLIPRRTIVFIKETVGLILPDGTVHDGLWYATDTGGAIKGQKIDLFTGMSAASMKQFLEHGLTNGLVSAVKMGAFQGCPPK